MLRLLHKAPPRIWSSSNHNNKTVFCRTKAWRNFNFYGFTLSVNLVGLILIFKWFSAQDCFGGAWRIDCLHRNPEERHLYKLCIEMMLSLSQPAVFGLIIQPLGTITSQLAFVFLQLKNNLFSSDKAAVSSWVCLTARVGGWNIYSFWHLSVWGNGKQGILL